MLITVTVEKNGKPLGHRLVKCESRMRELDQLLRSSDNPLQFMCQVSNTILILVLTFYFLFTSYSTESKGFARFEQPNQSKCVLSPHLEQFWVPTLFMTRKTHHDVQIYKILDPTESNEKQTTKVMVLYANTCFKFSVHLVISINDLKNPYALRNKKQNCVQMQIFIQDWRLLHLLKLHRYYFFIWTQFYSLDSCESFLK